MIQELQENMASEVFGGDPNNVKGYLIPPIKAGNIVISPGVKMPSTTPTISPASPNNKPVVKPIQIRCGDGYYNFAGICWPG